MNTKKKKCKKAKWLSQEALQIAVKRRETKSKGEKERYKHLNAEFQRVARRNKSLPQQSMQRNRRKQQNGKDCRSLQEDIKGAFYAKIAIIKNRNGMDLTEDIKKRWQEYTEELYKKIFMTQIITMV